MANRVSMEDIAKKVGVTKNTVSLVLRGMPGISEQTRHMVLKAAEEIGYVFTGADKKNSTPSKSICLIMPSNVRDSLGFFNDIQFGIENEARRNNINTIINYFDENDGYEIPLCIKDGLVSGVITLGRISEAYINSLISSNLPIVVVDHYFDHLKTDCILTDNQSSAFLAVEHLIEIGHSEIGFIGDINRSPSFYDRYSGFLKALDRHNISYNAIYSITGKSMELLANSNLQYVIDSLMELKKLPTAFFCCNDAEAIATLKALTIMGIKVPDDISLLGFDDIESSRNTIPGITTMRVEKEFMGNRAVKKLIDKLEGNTLPPEKLLISTVLVERQSLRRL